MKLNKRGEVGIQEVVISSLFVIVVVFGAWQLSSVSDDSSGSNSANNTVSQADADEAGDGSDSESGANAADSDMMNDPDVLEVGDLPEEESDELYLLDDEDEEGEN